MKRLEWRLWGFLYCRLPRLSVTIYIPGLSGIISRRLSQRAPDTVSVSVEAEDQSELYKGAQGGGQQRRGSDG